MKEFFIKVGAFFKKCFVWFMRIFEDADGLPSSKRVFGAFLVIAGSMLAFNGGEAGLVAILSRS